LADNGDVYHIFGVWQPDCYRFEDEVDRYIGFRFTDTDQSGWIKFKTMEEHHIFIYEYAIY